MQPGDLLAGHDGRWTAVQAVHFTDCDAPVYNLRVATDHTYFVVSRAWSFSLWVHNRYDVRTIDGVNWIVEVDDAGQVIRQVESGSDLAELLRRASEFNAPIRVADLPWGRVGAKQAAKAIEAGQTSIEVASRDDAAEVVWRMFSSRGFTNTTGRTGSDVRNILGSKAGTYHWDDVLDAAGNVAGHGADNVHGAMRHVQIHLYPDGDIIRIFFP